MNKLPHLRLEGTAESIAYTSTNPGGGKKFVTPPLNPSKHIATELKEGLDAARMGAADKRKQEKNTLSHLLQREPGGIVFSFESEKGHDLKLEGLEKIKDGIQLRNATEKDDVQYAKVFVPESSLSHFFKVIDTYATRTVITIDAPVAERSSLEAVADKKQKISVSVENHSEEQIRVKVTCPVSEAGRIKESISSSAKVVKDARKNTPLIDSIAKVRLALVEDFWTEKSLFPAPSNSQWWEVWLQALRNEVSSVEPRFRDLATGLGMRVSKRFVMFPERVVLLTYGSAEQFSKSIELLSMLAELRHAKELATPYLDLSAKDQKAFADDLLGKLVHPPENAPAVCILDSGVNRGHLLIEPALAESDAQAVDKDWGTADHDSNQHGTGMAGIALYGCLTNAFTETKEVKLRHKLESVKMLPPPPMANEPELYGAVTQEAVALAVIQNPTRNRAICMAVTANAVDQGLPSSWSGAVDEMCAGVLDETRKLMFISAGNVRGELYSEDYRYHEWNITKAGIEDPAQAWNALTVGAYTEKVMIQDPAYDGYEPIAEAGDLCPTSRTSLAWADENHAGWPIKPDFVCEGGNYATNGDARSEVEDLSLLTTHLKPGSLFDVTRDTSPATALAAKMAAELWSHYPNLWPETVRALLVHSAKWTNAMQNRFGDKTRGDIHRRLRCYGYGVPELGRAVYSLKNAATLIYEGQLQPYKFHPTKKGEAITNEMHLHSLPWPKEQLENLGEIPVTMRVTLSYFVEPSPGNVGWGANHRYASHGLRFDVIRPLEELKDFKQRRSRAEWENPKDHKSRPKSQKETRKWAIGEDGCTHGSIHSDWWQGTAVELAACNYVAVYPVTGWWRERAHLNRVESKARYSLIISIETPETNIDLYTPIQAATQVLTEVII
jgi:hypothetical protein